MEANCTFAYSKNAGDLPVGFALFHPHQHCGLAWRKPLDAIGKRRLSIGDQYSMEIGNQVFDQSFISLGVTGVTSGKGKEACESSALCQQPRCNTMRESVGTRFFYEFTLLW